MKAVHNPRIIGHRGNGQRELENTLTSIQQALSIGVDGIEFDVHSTSDGEIVVIHDATVDRTTNGSGFVQQLTSAQLKRLKVKGEEQIPTLQEVIQILRDYSELIINIDIKPPSIEKRVLEIIKLNEIESQVIISSKIYTTLKAVRQYHKRIQTGLLYDYHLEDPIQLAQQLEVTALHPEYSLLFDGIVNQAHHEGIIVNTWTVNDEAEMHRMIALGVDGIITDFPERFLRTVNSS